jgi:hypothetical protein
MGTTALGGNGNRLHRDEPSAGVRAGYEVGALEHQLDRLDDPRPALQKIKDEVFR